MLAAFALATAGRAAPPAPTDATLRALNIFLDQHGYGLAPAESTASNRQVVEARVNGRDIALIVDTGCTSTSLTRDCADALGLPVQPLPGFEVTGGGRISAGGVAVIQSFQLAGHEINRTPTIRVLPAGRPILGRLRTGRDADGLLGYDYLHLNAAILLVGSDRLLFKPGFSPVPPFDAAMTALGFKAVPLLHQHGELEITGHLNGLPIRAVVDCGAPDLVLRPGLRGAAGAHHGLPRAPLGAGARRDQASARRLPARRARHGADQLHAVDRAGHALGRLWRDEHQRLLRLRHARPAPRHHRPRPRHPVDAVRRGRRAPCPPSFPNSIWNVLQLPAKFHLAPIGIGNGVASAISFPNGVWERGTE
ncbi:MAG: retropepsin-like aspartic protease [Verrucomicrobiota bacterium]